jgi:1,2-phenylacetyl-CoA epoxidase catalytic subunit
VKTGYDNLDEAYRDMMPWLVNYARGHLVQTDYAIDAANMAFEMSLKYFKKHKNAKISSFIIKERVKRACRKLNKKLTITAVNEVPILNLPESINNEND